jgi:hypothetical protein
LGIWIEASVDPKEADLDHARKVADGKVLKAAEEPTGFLLETDSGAGIDFLMTKKTAGGVLACHSKLYSLVEREKWAELLPLYEKICASIKIE